MRNAFPDRDRSASVPVPTLNANLASVDVSPSSPYLDPLLNEIYKVQAKPMHS